MSLKLSITIDTFFKIIIAFCGFFLSIGSGINKIVGYDISKFFLVFSSILIFFSFFRKKFPIFYFPKSYFLFIIFVFIHSLIIWCVIFNQELFESYSSNDEPFIILIFRFYFFIFFGVFIALYFNEVNNIKVFIQACNIGFFISFIFGLYETFFHNAFINLVSYDFRVSGGFSNPNTFGQFSLMVFFINLLFINGEISKRFRLFLIIFIAIGCMGVILSQSRAAFLGLLIFVLYSLYKSSWVNKLKILLLTFILIVGVFLILPSKITDRIENRIFKPQQNSRTNRPKEERLIIWEDYLNNLPSYVLFGYGKERERYITRDSATTKTNFVTHNSYLNILTNFGIIGLILFMFLLFSLLFQFFSLSKIRKNIFTDRLFISWIVSWFVILTFGDYINSRDFWIFIAIAIGYLNMDLNALSALNRKLNCA